MSGEHHANGSDPTRTQTEGRGNRPPPVQLLVMGPQGCGKSSFINSVVGQTDCLTTVNSKLCTKIIRSCKSSKWIGGSEFRFIDTPGFGNEVIDNRRIFERLVEYFAPNPRDPRYEPSTLPRRVTGLLYIHSEDGRFKDRTSQKAIEMLVKIMGERFLDRVTVLIRSQSKSDDDFFDFMPPEDSPLYPLYCNNTKPWTSRYRDDSESIEQMLGPYIHLYPRLVRLAALDNFALRDGNNWQYDDIPRHLREYFPEDIGPPVTTNHQSNGQPRLQEQENEIGRLRNSIAQYEKEIQELRSTHDAELEDLRKKTQTEKSDHELNLKSLYNTIRDNEEEISKLKSNKNLEFKELETLKEEAGKAASEKNSAIEELERRLKAKDEEIEVLKAESERKIQDSMNAAQTKESEIMELKAKVNGTTIKANNKQADDVIRLNEEIRRIKAEYASLRNHMQVEENVEQADITKALGDINRLIEEFGQGLSEHIEKHNEKNPPEKASQMQDLLKAFGPVGSELASKLELDTYALLEYAVQATICDQLSTQLFKPFHPSIADDRKRNTFISRVYEQISQEEQQSVSGRWRKDTFNSISKHPNLGKQEAPDDKRMYRLITEALSALLTKVAEIQPEVVFKKHNRALVKVITKAEDLNQLLKGGISMLGDFQPTVFHFGDGFRPEYMTDVNASSRRGKNPDKIITTVELGLVRRYAHGGSRKPEETVLRRAGVLGLPN